MLDLLVLLLVAVACVDFFAPRSYVEQLRNQLLDYWVFVSELAFSQELSQHVRTVRLFLQRNLWTFLFVLGVALFGLSVVATGGAFYKLYKDPTQFVKSHLIEEDGSSAILNTLQNDIEGAVIEIFPEKYAAIVGEKLTPSTVVDDCRERHDNEQCARLLSAIENLQKRDQLLQAALSRLPFERAMPFGIKLVLVAFATHIINTVVYLISFLISAFVTIRLLRSMERIRATSLVLCLIDIVLAVVIPVAVLTVVVTVLAFATVPLGFSHLAKNPDEAGFETNVALYFAVQYYYLQLFAIMTSKLLYKIFTYGDGSLERALLLVKYLLLWGWGQLELFFLDMKLAASGRIFEIPTDDAQRNWTIALSILFSFVYIAAVSFMLLGTRSFIFRELIARILQQLIEHPGGPIARIALLLAGTIFVARLYWT